MFSLVPFDGVSGTRRRPIYLECTATCIRIQPEGMFFGPTELEGFSERLNPLVLGVHALVEHWNVAAAAAEGDPYVLLNVRPSGIITFYLSRSS